MFGSLRSPTPTPKMKFLPRFVILCLLFAVACCHNNDEALAVPPIAQFTRSTLSFPESDGQNYLYPQEITDIRKSGSMIRDLKP
jgi:hypothetical protein